MYDQQNALRFAHAPDFARPSKPNEWFYDPSAIRSDSFGFRQTITLGSAGETYPTAIPVNSTALASIRWKSNRLVLGIFAAVELSITPVNADSVVNATAFLARGNAGTIDLVCPISPDPDGGIPSLLCGTFCGLNLPSGAAGAKSKNFGVGFGRTPILIRGGEYVSWYANYTIPPAPATGYFIGSATFYTVPAQ